MKRFVIMMMLVAAITPSLSGCFGKFALTRKVYAVNASVHDRYLRNVVTWAFLLVPVYWVSGVVDLFIFNTVEFWSGSNPMASTTKSFQYASGDQTFKVLANREGESIRYTIDRYRVDRYLDTLVINSDLLGNATATYRQAGHENRYALSGSGATSLTAALMTVPAPARTGLYN